MAYAEILQGIGVEQWHSQDFDRGGDLAVAYAEFLQGEGDEQEAVAWIFDKVHSELSSGLCRILASTGFLRGMAK